MADRVNTMADKANNIAKSVVSTEKTPLNKNLLIGAGVFLVIVFLWFGYKIFVSDKQAKFGDKPIDKLTENGWEVYVTNNCPYCIEQVNILNQHFPYFTNIYNDRPVESVPTWYNTKTKEKKVGRQTYDQLLEMAK